MSPSPSHTRATHRYGKVFHTGDWKFDDNPQLGPPSDYGALADLGTKGVLAIVGDSTNATTPVCQL